MTLESPEVERWLDAEFEHPAEQVIAKVARQERLTSDDWYRLVRFLAAQDVRTPTRLMEAIRRWQRELPGMLDGVMREAVAKLEAAHRDGRQLEIEPRNDNEGFGGKLTTSIAPGADTGTMRYEVVVGRNLWLSNFKHLLTRTVQRLHRHHWTILRAPQGLEWPTSDDPVIRLDFHSAANYDFGGGWVAQVPKFHAAEPSPCDVCPHRRAAAGEVVGRPRRSGGVVPSFHRRARASTCAGPGPGPSGAGAAATQGGSGPAPQ
ncbi:MAG TPA: DUF4238 domain-containing protein [Solimonas sp.]|nr:DUF4238 domain-containing protein [Solimonas sp.]